MPTTLINLNSTTPPAPGGGLNVIFQNDSSNPINVSAYVVLSSVVVTPAGSDTDVQVNSGGSLYADSGFTYNHTTGLVNITRTIFVGPPDSSFSTFEGGAPAYFGVDAAACANRISALNTADAGMINAFAVIEQEDLASATEFSAGSIEAWTTNASTVTIDDSVFPEAIVGLSAGAHHIGAGDLAGTNNGPVGLYCTATLETTAHVSTITSAVFDTGNGGAGTIDLATAIWIPSIGDPGGTITEAVGIYIAPQVAGAVTTWAIYVDGTTPSFYGGPIDVESAAASSVALLDVNNDATVATTPNLGNVMIRGKSIGGIGASGPTLLMLMPDSSPEGGTNGWVVGNANDTGNGFISAQVLNGSPSTPLITLSNGTTTVVLGVNDGGPGGSIGCVGGDFVITTNAHNVIIGDSGFILTQPTPTTSASQLGLGTTVGFGNGTPVTPVTTTTTGTGSGPTTPQTVVNYLEIDLAGTKYWIPLVQ